MLRVPLTRLRLDTPDGDFLDLDVGPEPSPGCPLAIVLHGLGGSARRPYALHAYQALARHGIRPVGLNFRGCSGEPNRLARSYHSGETGDLAFALGHLRSRFPGRRVGALGFSLGGNVLLKYLGETGVEGADAVRAAVAVSVPFDLAASALALERGIMGWVYSRYFLRTLVSGALRKRTLLERHVPLDRLRGVRTIRQFDELLTAPLHGFRDADHYYGLSSSGSFLGTIRVPTLLLHSRDDPFLPASSIPRRKIEANPRLRAAFTECGGHLGFVEGALPWRLSFWAEREAVRFLAHELGSPISS